MNPKPYTDSDRSNRLWWYLLLITLLSAFCYITLDVWLLPCSIAYHETGTMTAGYLLYAAIGLLFSTPTPFIAVLIISLFIEKIGIRQMFLNIFRTEEKLKTVLMLFQVLIRMGDHLSADPLASVRLGHKDTGNPRADVRQGIIVRPLNHRGKNTVQ